MTKSRLRSCALALALSTVFLTTHAALADLTRSFAVGVNGCDSAVQLCTPIPTVALPTAGVLQAQFNAATTHCSSIIARFRVDGVERSVSGALSPGQGTAVLNFGPIAAGFIPWECRPKVSRAVVTLGRS